MIKLLKTKERIKNKNIPTEKKFVKYLSSLGFRRHKKAVSTCGEIFINKKAGIVMKKSFVYTTSKSASNFRIPTEKIKINGDLWLIQPMALCDYDSRKIAFKYLSENLTPKQIYNIDYHQHNVGLYRNKAVLIDW